MKRVGALSIPADQTATKPSIVKLDLAPRLLAARAGFAQGKQEATRVSLLSRLHADARRYSWMRKKYGDGPVI